MDSPSIPGLANPSTSSGNGSRLPDGTPRGVSSFDQILLESGLLSGDQLAQAQETARREMMPLGRILVRDGLAQSRGLAALTALHLSLTMVDLRSQQIDPQATVLLPEELARKYAVLPVSKDGNRLTVAMADPADLLLIQNLTVRTGFTIDPMVATLEDILEHIDIAYRLTEKTSGEQGADADANRGTVTTGLLQDAPTADLIDLLVHRALQDRASDIHIEPSEFRLRVRFRIDGLLHYVISLPMDRHPALVSRIKIMAGLNIAERRRPQDGQFTVEVQARKVDVRVAVVGTVDGEMVVLRLLDKHFTLMGLDQLGMGSEIRERFRKLLRLPYGMVVVCGPTGAGKSTTLYAAILQMNRVEQKVISLEDPVEYRINDANQMQVHTDAGITFATQLRSTLRLDPDVIMVGEIRDQETAVIATQAALTGHLVLTSLHANDAVSALLRLKDLGVAPYLIASSIAGIVSQRMVRVVCKGCEVIMERPVTEQTAYASEMAENRESFVYGTGCNLCAHTGYRGRSGVFEVLTMTDALRKLFLEDAARNLVTEQAVMEGMVPMRRDGMLKVREGVTTPYEIMRVLFSLE